ncbi:uncharacterized protein [Manis javanica]|uniref:uncharacterized protein n=1 Tax=Manis javanica TaxID=9974 RepID=UPI003C6CF2C3
MDTVMGAQLTTQKSLDEVSHLHARKQALASYRICRLLDLRLSNSMFSTRPRSSSRCHGDRDALEGRFSPPPAPGAARDAARAFSRGGCRDRAFSSLIRTWRAELSTKSPLRPRPCGRPCRDPDLAGQLWACVRAGGGADRVGRPFSRSIMDPSLLREWELFKKRALSTPVVEKRLLSSESSSSSSKKKKAKLEHGGSSGSKQISEFQKLWRSVVVDSMDEEIIEEYLKRQGISSMQESGPKKVPPIQRRKKPTSQKKRRFKTHNEHVAGVLKDYSDIAPGK